MIDDTNDKAAYVVMSAGNNLTFCYLLKPVGTFVELHTASQKLLDQIVRNGPRANVLDDNFHLRIVGEASILLLKSKMRRM